MSLLRHLAPALLLLGLCPDIRAQDFEINEGLSGTWFNPATPGQGFLIDVVAADGFLFVAWFTYETAEGSKLGVPETRWLTAQGNYEGAEAVLPLTLTRNGQFDDPAPVDNSPAGILELAFLSCTEAVARYTLDEGPEGEIPLQRLTPDVLCGDLTPPPSASTVSITYLGNEGVVIDDGDRGIAIDAIGTWGSPWITVPANIASQLRDGVAPFAGVSVAAITHNHGDHFSPSQVNAFLAADQDRRVIMTPSGRGSLTAAQSETLAPPRFSSNRLEYPGFSVTVVNTRHFNQFGNDFSAVDNYTYIVEIDGRVIVHTGDIDYAEDNFQAIADQLDGPPDAIVIPTFNTLISTGNAALIEQFFGPTRVIGAHFRSTQLNFETQAFLSSYPEGTVFDQPLEAVVLP